MSILATSPEICIGKVHPFEIRMLTYYWTAYRTLVAKGNLDNSTNPAHLVGSPHFVGSNPFSSERFISAFKSKEAYQDIFSGLLPDVLCYGLSAYYRRLLSEYC